MNLSNSHLPLCDILARLHETQEFVLAVNIIRTDRLMDKEHSPVITIHNISLTDGKTRKFHYQHDAAAYRLTIKKPAVNMAEDWSIVLYA